MPSSPRLRLLTADTGGGHRAAANAIAASVERLRPDVTVEILDVFGAARGPARHMPAWYAWVMGWPRLWLTMFRALDGRRRRHLMWAPLTLMEPDWFRQVVVRGSHDALVILHPAFPTCASLWASREASRPAVCTVVTDPVSGHASWFEGKVDLMVVSTERAAARARTLGVDEDRLAIIDHPVHPRVPTLSKSREALRERYRWQGASVVLCTGGGDASQTLFEVVTALRAIKDARIVVVCGRNEALRRKLGDIAGVEALGFVDDLPERMAAADIVVSKAGPSTVAEAGAVGTPLVIYGYMPGQEDGNLDWVVERGWGCVALGSGKVRAAVEGLLADTDGLRRRRKTALAAAAQPSASCRIAALLLERAQEVFDARNR